MSLAVSIGTAALIARSEPGKQVEKDVSRDVISQASRI